MKKLKLFIATLAVLTLNFVNCQAQVSNLHLLDFNGTNGKNPYGDLISDGTYLYGMTYEGGPSSNYGTVFKIKPDGTGYDTLINFLSTGPNGNLPYGSLYYDGTFLYGMTQNGGTNNYGTIFKIKPDGTGRTVLLEFDGTNGRNPDGSLISDGTYLYGMTPYGGTNGTGTIFKIKPNGTKDTVLLNFNSNSSGSGPTGSLYFDGTFLYGININDGVGGAGDIFKIKPDGTGYTDLFDFNITANGIYPEGNLISDGTYFYGMTFGGGANNKGTIYKINPNGTGFTVLLNFNGTTGYQPYGSLIYDGTAFLYGMTNAGGANGVGNIFKIKTDGTDTTNLLDFNIANGKNPQGSLYYDGTFLYGMTLTGGPNNDGVLFKLYPGCSYSAILTSALGTDTQSVCINTAITDITYSVTGGTTVTGLPLGLNGSFSSGIFTISGIPSVAGTYNYTVATTGTCVQTATTGNIIITNCTTGIINNNSETNVYVYPNPTTGIINIQLGQIERAQIKIHDIYGEFIEQSIITSSHFQIDLSRLPNGVYFISIQTNEDIVNTKMLISH